jgi:hypothetical protein
VIPLNLFEGASKFPLLAIPLFILAGGLMETGFDGGEQTRQELRRRLRDTGPAPAPRSDVEDSPIV